MSSTPITPPDLDEVRGRLRDRIADLPTVLAQWPSGEGPLADVPLLDPGTIAPKAFSEISGTVRVAATQAELITIAGLLTLPTGALLVTAMAVSPADLSMPPDVAASRRVLAEQGARAESLMVEVAALISPVAEDGDGPAAAVGLVRPLVCADPGAFPHPDDTVDYDAALRQAARDAVVDEGEVIADLAGSPLTPLPSDLARLWSPLFSIARAATVGLAARGAGLTEDGT